MHVVARRGILATLPTGRGEFLETFLRMIGMQGSFDSAEISLREIPAALRMTGLKRSGALETGN
jgi:hypothetical protein